MAANLGMKDLAVFWGVGGWVVAGDMDGGVGGEVGWVGGWVVLLGVGGEVLGFFYEEGLGGWSFWGGSMVFLLRWRWFTERVRGCSRNGVFGVLAVL